MKVSSGSISASAHREYADRAWEELPKLSCPGDAPAITSTLDPQAAPTVAVTPLMVNDTLTLEPGSLVNPTTKADPSSGASCVAGTFTRVWMVTVVEQTMLDEQLGAPASNTAWSAVKFTVKVSADSVVVSAQMVSTGRRWVVVPLVRLWAAGASLSKSVPAVEQLLPPVAVPFVKLTLTLAFRPGSPVRRTS